jgi:caffeoyl-CoA O-methyltransferase
MARGITNQAVEEYIYKILPRRDAVLQEMEDLARKENIPIIGPAVARLLSLVAQAAGTRRIFEMGSAIGYSTLWLARATGPRGEIFYTDAGEKNILRAQDFLKRGGVAKRVRFLRGDALKLLRETPGQFDMIFIDVDKDQYPASLRLALPRIRRGGLLAADNTLWSGKVAGTENDENTEGIREFNRLTFRSRKLFPAIVPLRDGVTICRKL